MPFNYRKSVIFLGETYLTEFSSTGSLIISCLHSGHLRYSPLTLENFWSMYGLPHSGHFSLTGISQLAKSHLGYLVQP